VSWAGVVNATSYIIYCGTSNSSSSATQYGGEIIGNKYTITDLPLGAYYIWIKAKNTAGTSAFSLPANSGYPIFLEETIAWESDGQGYSQYLTNEKTNFESLSWMTFPSTNQSPTSVPIIGEVKHISGYGNAGRGIVFNYLDSNNFYRVLINSNLEYKVDKRVAGTFTTLQNWTFSAYLFSDPTESTIKIYSIPSGFTVSFGVHATPDFTSSDMTFRGGRAGFIAEVGSAAQENFTSIPTDVRIRMISPITIP